MSNIKILIESTPEIRHNILRRLAQIIFVLILMALLMFIPAGSISWPYAWLYLALYLLAVLTGAFFLPLEVIAERGSKKVNVENWDKVVSRLLTASVLSIFIVGGLDFRWNWSPELTMGVHLLAIFIYCAGVALEIWAMIENTFFSTAVRIQFDRGHTVCTRGPYRYVRHPGYLGMIIFYLATAIFLGTLWALIPGAITAVLFIVRTWLEDRTLFKKLPGYAEYAAGTRYRLIPGIW